MQILHSILRLLRRPGVATSPVPMHRLSSTSRSLVSFMASTPPHSALARRVFPLMGAPNPALHRVSGFSHGSRIMATTSGGKGYKPGKPGKRSLISSTNSYAISRGMKKVEVRGTPLEVKRNTTKERKRAVVVSDDEEEDVITLEVLPKSTHRDGSIYNTGTHPWKRNYHVADRSETRLEAMMLSNPTDCVISDGICTVHNPCHMLQIFSLKLAKLFVDIGPVELYGYIAVRDSLDPLLNYVVNLRRDHPITVEQGSLIKMAGPKRGIDLYGSILIEYDMKIKTGEQEKDDLQLIDGISAIGEMGGLWNCAFKKRIPGDHGEVDLTASRILHAVEATVEVVISEVQSRFKMRLCCFIGGFDEEIQLFDGIIGESQGLQRSVVALVDGSAMDLKFKVGAESSSSAEHGCSFDADTHGHATQEIKTDFGLISVKVAWSTLIHGY